MINRFKMALVALVSLFVVIGGGTFGSPAQAAPAPVSGVVMVSDGVISALEFVPINAKRAVQPCTSGYLCFYGCYLSGSCGYWFTLSGSGTACNNVYAKHVYIYSVINNSNYTHRVWQTSNCTTLGSPTSALYAHTSANMNSDWDEDAIGSTRKA